MNAIDLQNAVEGKGADNFTVLLLRLIMKADSTNREKLRVSYPVEVASIEMWRYGNCSDQFKYDVLLERASEFVKTGKCPDGYHHPYIEEEIAADQEPEED